MIKATGEQGAHAVKSVWRGRTLQDLFDTALEHSADKEAVIDPPNRADLCGGEPRRLTYVQLDREAQRLAEVLAENGTGRGDVVLAQLPNIVELVALYLAVTRLGAVISPVPMQYGRHELEGIVQAARPVLAVTVSQFKGYSPLAVMRDVMPGPPLIALDAGDDSGVIDYAAALAVQAGDRQWPAPYPDQGLTLCWTSGTTGTPKGVPRTHAHWMALLPVFEDAIALPRHATLLCPFPMVNMAALSAFFVYWLGLHGRLVLHHPLELPVFLGQVQQEKAAFTVAPPALLNMLLAKKDLLEAFDLSSLQRIGSGSAPLSSWMIEGFRRELGVDVINMFGSNEGTCLLSDAEEVPDAEHRAVFFPRFGRPEFQWRNRIASEIATKLVDIESDEEISEGGQPGELMIKGATVFDGYLNSDAVNAELFDGEGYFRTGDLFEIAGERGEFYRFVGRCKDIIIRGGHKISPEELDRVLMAHPDIADVATAGFPDPQLGEKVCAFVVPEADRTATLESLSRYLEEAGVARFKHPQRIEIRDSLPRNPLGKVLRTQLQESLQ